MRLTHLALTNFRNYTHLDLSFPAGAVLLHGANAQGKTTLLENLATAIHEDSPETRIVVLLIDERPEEVTHFRRATPADHAPHHGQTGRIRRARVAPPPES